MALTPQEQREMDQLEYDQLMAEKQASERPASPSPRSEAFSPVGETMDALIGAAGYGGRGTLATTARVGSSLLATEGGPLGAAIGGGGESLAQLIEGGKVDRPGQVAAAGVLSAVPLGAAKGAWNAAKNALKLTGGAVTGEEVRSLIDEGKLSDPTAVAGLTGALSLAAPVVGKAIGKVIGKVAPEESARVAELQTRNATRDASLKAGQDIGMVVPPTAVNDTFINRRIEGLAGGPRVGREATLKNNIAGGSAVREEIGLTKHATLDDEVLNSLEHTAAEPYRRVKALSDNGGIVMYHDGTGGFLTTDASAVRAGPSQSAKFKPENPLVVPTSPNEAQLDAAFQAGHDAVVVDSGGGRIDAFVPDNPGRSVIYHGSPVDTAAADLEALKQARADAKGYYKRDATNYDPSNRVKAQAAMDKARMLEDRISVAAAQSGDPQLANQLKQARVEYAKLEATRSALNPDSGELNLNKFGAMSRKRAPLTGALKTVGDFANATEGRFTKPSASIPNPGSSALEPAGVFLGGIAGGVKGAALGLTNAFIRDPVRAMVLSKVGQKVLATPRYRPNTGLDPAIIASMQRFAGKMALMHQTSPDNVFLGSR